MSFSHSFELILKDMAVSNVNIFISFNPNSCSGMAQALISDLKILLLSELPLTVYGSQCCDEQLYIDDKVIPYYQVTSSGSIVNLSFSFVNDRLYSLFDDPSSLNLIYCWNTPFLDSLLFYRSPCSFENIILVSHGTFSGVRVALSSFSRLARLPIYLVYELIVLPVILRKVSRVCIIGLNIDSYRFSDVRKICKLGHFSKIILHFNSQTSTQLHSSHFLPIHIDSSSKRLCLITKATYQKGFHLIYKFIEALDKLLQSSDAEVCPLHFDIYIPSPPVGGFLASHYKNLTKSAFSNVHVSVIVGLSIDSYTLASRDYSLGLNLSRIEVEPFAVTNLILHSVPVIGFNAGSLCHLTGYLVFESVYSLACVTALFATNHQVTRYLQILGKLGSLHLRSR